MADPNDFLPRGFPPYRLLDGRNDVPAAIDPVMYRSKSTSIQIHRCTVVYIVNEPHFVYLYV
jgi:hypothetical protein